MMAQYKVLERSFIGDSIQEEGAIVSLPDDAVTGSNLERVESFEMKPVDVKSKG
jgi:hypothetical protein